MVQQSATQQNLSEFKVEEANEHPAEHRQINVFVSTDCMNTSTGRA
jgi:hypothetical protein